ncbi:MAG: MFS transporter [Xanthomonadales bacterium]|nr:MFS transporter [Xanthomonadales bacterium]
MGGNTRWQRTYVLVLLMVVYIFNFIDRQILVILQESIKADMGLSDAQLGILSGFAFAIFYVSFGIPIARWADVGNRRNIVALALAVWSGMTALCGLAQNYLQLVLARIGVGVGEAGGSPPAHSIISDYYPFAERGRALSIYSMGVFLGILVGFLAGGWLDEFFGWRTAFLVVGVPGILLAIVVRLTIREPTRGQSDTVAEVRTDENMFGAVKKLWSLKSFRYASLGAGMLTFVSYGVGNFVPSFLIRSHGLTVGEVGTYLALTAGIGGAAGTYLGGWLSDKLGERTPCWYLWIPAVGNFVAVPLMALSLLVDAVELVIALNFAYWITFSTFLAPSIAISHGLVGASRRALASSVLFFVLNLIGLGLGPVSVGLLSDGLSASLGVDSLRWAMIIACASGVVGACLYLWASRFLMDELPEGATT